MECHLGPCFSELDISIVDRLHNLIHCKPAFLEKSLPNRRSLFEVPSDNNFVICYLLLDFLNDYLS